jgi:hypothetical protein
MLSTFSCLCVWLWIPPEDVAKRAHLSVAGFSDPAGPARDVSPRRAAR